MTNQIDHIVEHLFHKSTLDDVSETELEEFIATSIFCRRTFSAC